MTNKNLDIQEIEAARDEKWVEVMSLYVPSIVEKFKEDEITIENIVHHFQLQILDQERENSRPPIFGQRVVSV